MSQYKCVTELEKWLDSFLNFEKKPEKNIFWLDTVQFFCRKLGNPETFCPSVHIAGSKGKGSVSAMLSSILEESGAKTGLYTSPHIIDFIERIGTSHSCFSEEIYEKAAQELKSCVNSTKTDQLPGQRPVTWFELVTIYAFLCFRQAKNNFSVFETGLGGRLDATNVLTPELCILMPIELEHTQFLGSTLAQIAAEKAGIIKENTPVISARQENEAEKIFEEKAMEKNAPFYKIEQLVDRLSIEYTSRCIKNNTLSENLSNKTFSLKENQPSTFQHFKMKTQISGKLFKKPVCAELQLLGKIQAENAAIAACAAKLLLPQLDEEIIASGLEKAFLPGRFETISDRIILDGAHTVNSIKFTMNTFNTLFPQKKAHLLFACASDKDMTDIAELLKNRFEKIILTKPGSVKHSDINALKLAFDSAGLTYTAIEDYRTAIRKALENAEKEDAVLLATGSFYLVAEIKKELSLNRHQTW